MPPSILDAAKHGGAHAHVMKYKWASQPVSDFRKHGPTHDRPNMLTQIGLGGPYGPTYGSKKAAQRISDI